MKKKLKGVDILYMVLLGLCVIMVGIAIGKTRLYDMWNEELICNILHLQQEEQIAEDRHMNTNEDSLLYIATVAG